MSETNKPIPDEAARELALDVSRSVIVQAPAGSGKTELLTQRLLKLLSRVEHPEEVLAITFTRKAAGEMRNRLLDSLARAADAPCPGTAHEARNWRMARELLAVDQEKSWRLLEHPARLRIMTIDALSAKLTRQMPLLAQLGANLDIAAAPELLYREAAVATLELLVSDHAVRAQLVTLVHHLDNDPATVISLIADMLKKREQWLRHLLPAAGRPLDKGVMEAAIARMIGAELAALKARFPKGLLAALSAAAQQSAMNLAATDADNPLAAWLENSDPHDRAEDLPAWQALAQLLLTDRNDWRKSWNRSLGFLPAEKERKAEFIDLVARLQADEELKRGLVTMRRLPGHVLPDQQWEALNALIAVLPVAAAQLELVFRRHGKVDYTAVSRAALDALGEELAPTDLALSLDYRIQHILVDEFQDTSASQYELITRLIAGWSENDGRTLFCVGDPMQSIYRFREAEVGLFLRAWQEGIGDLVLKPVNLSVNFRSQQGVVQWVNQVFPQIMPERADLQTAAVPYTRSYAHHEKLPGDAVVFHPHIDAGPDLEARTVARLVSEHRAAHPGDSVAILVSGRNHLREIVPTLREAGLNPRAVEIERLDRQPVVHDLLALTRALLHRGDRTAWLAILRAPWCGLSLPDMYALAHDAPDVAIGALIEDQDRLGALSEDGQKTLARFKAALWPVLADSGRQPLRRWVERAWLRLGGPGCLSDAVELDNAEAFFNLLATLSEDRAVEDPSVLNERLAELFASPDPQADEGLLIMTVHKAKGLQFDVVIVPGLDRAIKGEEKELLRWLEFPRSGGGSDLVLAPVAAKTDEKNSLHEYLQDLERRRRDLERGRLLYVAVTRARKRVHLVARVQTKDIDGQRTLVRPRARTMLEALWPAARPWFEAAFAAGDADELPAGQAAESHSMGVPTTSFLPRDWQAPSPPQPVKTPRLLQARVSISEEAISFDWAGQTARNVGTAVHEGLHSLAEAGGLALPESTGARLRARLAELGTHRGDLDLATELAYSALERSIQDERGRWILATNHIDARNELALSSVADGSVYSVILDRTFIDVHGCRWVIDYKVGVHEGADLEAFFDREVVRYQPQLERYARIISQLDERPVMTALYFPLYAGWRAWDPFAAGGRCHT